MASWDENITAVYIVANRRNGTIYTGVTSNLIQRMGQHRDGAFSGFTKKYGCKQLVWFEPHDLISEAIRREKVIKKYGRAKKIEMIEETNPDWQDLWFRLVS